jgi:regulator of sirC expression with transglutaminase-like and TPR domain
MHRSVDEPPLAESALLIAAHANPELDVGGHLALFEEMAERVAAPDTTSVCALLFNALGLRGNHDDYDDPRNSFLDEVLKRRLGLPISLAVLLIEIGRRCGIPLEGVGMPGHFLVRDRRDPEHLIDPFEGGRRLDFRACQDLLRATVGGDALLEPDMLQGVGSTAIVARMLTNLDRSYQRRGDLGALTWVTRLRIALRGRPAAEQLDVAGRAAALGWIDQAAEILDRVAGQPELASEFARRLRGRSLSMRASLN